MSFSVGNLELDITGSSRRAVEQIDVTAKALRRLASSVDAINNTQFVFAGDKLEVLFNKIAKATNSINIDNISNLASAGKSLSSIAKIGNLEKVDFDKVGAGFQNLAVAIEPFLKRVQEAEASLVSLDGILKKSSGKKIQGLGNSSSRGGLFGLAKIGISIYSMRRLGRFAANLVQAGSDYTETLNLWQVAMRENIDLADEFVNKMNRAYGISTKTLMQAQATFKNMIGSLGQISDEVAYKLSEALVQMSADFSSLYNVKLQSAFEKMQSMLAGQVRPIRSAGLDMTETTLYQYYQQIGGTKTMRQLNRTEKQLLSILAVYRQMGSAGALGDMSKTLNQFANQSRMMTEYWAELKTWSGLLLKDLIDQSGALIYINATLITITEIVKAIAKSRGLGEDNFIEGMFETTEATNDAVDELQGKLLDFDKFRSLEDTGASPLAVDEKLLEAISGYSSQIDNAANKAQDLAEKWMIALGFTRDENGELVLVGDNLERVKEKLEGIGTIITFLFSFGIWAAIVRLGTALYTYGVKPLISIAKTIITNLVPAIKQSISFLDKHKLAIGRVVTALAAMQLSYSLTTGLINQFSGTGRKVASTAAIIVGAIMAIVAAVVALKSVASWGTMLPVLLAGVGAAIAGVQGLTPNVEMYAEGAGDIDGGTLFVAGEMGRTEAVYTGGNGKTNVANVKQMEQAFYNALLRHSREGGDTVRVEAYLDGEKVYENTTYRAKLKGNAWAKA